jgi:hypothetical protein
MTGPAAPGFQRDRPCCIIRGMATTKSSYQPNESPFGELYSQYIRDDRDFADVLAEVDVETLDEFRSCADYQLTFPAYADDSRLRLFRIALDVHISMRLQGFARGGMEF